MAELGEPVAIGVIDEDTWECPFAHKKPGVVTNHLENDAAKLGTRVKNGWSTQAWEEQGDAVVQKDNRPGPPKINEAVDCPGGTVDVDGRPYPYSVAAHHLIPGEASLPKTKLMQFIKKGKIWGDIGYDVNGGENGLYLPTHSSLSAQMDKGEIELPNWEPGSKYSKLSKTAKKEGYLGMASFQEIYTFRAMQKTGRQFHDAHPEYNSQVVDDLDAINVKLFVTSGYHCDKCKESKNNDGLLPPPYTLVWRLNALSRRLAGRLWGKPNRWKSPYFTSRFAYLMTEYEQV